MNREDTIAKEILDLRRRITESNNRLQELAKEREQRARKVALEKAYPSRLKQIRTTSG